MATNVSSSLPDLPSSHRCGSVSNHLWIPAAFPHHGRPTNTAPILKGFSVAISVTSRGGTNGSNPFSSSKQSVSRGISVKRHSELTPWRHEELTPPGCVIDGRSGTAERVVHGVHRGDPRRERAPLIAQRAMARGVPVDPRGRPAVPVWHRTFSLAQSRAAARCWPVRRDRDRRQPARPRRWRRCATPRAARRAMLRTQPVASGVWQQRRAIAAVGWHGGSAVAGAPAPCDCRLGVGGSGPAARPRSARAHPAVCVL